MGVHEQIVDSRKRAYFIALLDQSFADPPSPEYPYRLADKLMYGTDWFMPGRVFPQVDYLLAYQMAFLDPRIVPYYRKFFFENALDYLDVAERLARNDLALPAAVRGRLQRLQALR
jgi:hypothetical protein